MALEHPALEHDAIREAVFEMQFQKSSDMVTEIFLGKVADFDDWRAYKQIRLPISEIPESLRRADPKLQHQPLIELVSEDGKDAIRIGPDVLMLSRRGDYQGWDGGFGDDVEKIAKRLFTVLPDVVISRLGLRYINALQSDVHGINGCSDLQVDLSVAQSVVSTAFNLNFKTRIGTNFEAMNRLATVDFTSGNIPENATVVLDIHVQTEEGYEVSKINDVLKWAKLARDEKNERFFSVLGESVTQRLRKK